ncbi:MAG: hypothetical protein AAFV53_38585 [Myxococcota bacterium]
MRAETLPLLRALRRPRPRSPRLITGLLDGAEVGVLTCGIGPARAAARLHPALALWPTDAILSLGTCGALQNDLNIGDAMTADALYEEASRQPAPHPWPGVPIQGTLVTVHQPVWDAARRDALAAHGMMACEMEAAALQRAAAPLPLYTLKVISDFAGGRSDDPGQAPGAVDFARFQVRAAALSAAVLLPMTRAGLAAV